ncbi:hypothetical protein LCGC14_1816170, partial [marine sediment metagenome]
MAGKRLGFEDTRGTLIYDVIRILKEKRPKAFLLENVRGLLSHEDGNTFYVIRKLLGDSYNGLRGFFKNPDSLGYNVFYKVLNSADFGLAQNRRRIFIVGFRPDVFGWKDFKFPKGHDKSKVIGDILEDNINNKYFITENEIEKLENHKKKQFQKGNSFSYSVKKVNEKCGSILATYGKGVSDAQLVSIDNKYFLTKQEEEKYKKWDINNTCQYRELASKDKTHTLLTSYSKGAQGAFYFREGKNPVRIFTPRECARLQGYSESFKIHKDDRQAYRQFGNAVSPPVVSAIVKEIKKIIC